MENIKDKEFIRDYIKNLCIYKPSEPYMYGKMVGTRYGRQYYLANGTYDVEFLNCVCRQFYKIIDEEVGHFNFQITGREWAALPLLSAIPLWLYNEKNIRINSFMIKRERKTYGRNNYIEGLVNKLPVLIIDDVCNSTNGFLHCYNVITKTEKLESLPYIFAILNKYITDISVNSFVEDRYLKRGIKPLSIVNGNDMI